MYFLQDSKPSNFGFWKGADNMKHYIIDLEDLCDDIICNLYDSDLIVDGVENFDNVRDVLLYHLSQIRALQLD